MDEKVKEFGELLDRVRAGEEDAIRILYERYSDEVIRAIRRYLKSQMRRQYDSVDFAQSVWMSFLRLPATRCPVSTPDELVGFLWRMAMHKVIDATRQKMGTQKYDIARETSIDQPDRLKKRQDLGDGIAACYPTPTQVMIADELGENA